MQLNCLMTKIIQRVYYFSLQGRFAIMFCLKLKNKPKKDPIFDLEKVIHDMAWEKFLEDEVESRCDGCTAKMARRAFKMDVDWAMIGREDIIVDYGTDSRQVHEPKKIQMFQTKFQNTTGSELAQKFIFNCEKQVSSSNELSVSEGFSIGGTLNLSPKVDGEKVGLPVSLEGGLELSSEWRGDKGETLINTDTITWSMDAEVQLKKNEIAYVTAEIVEAEVEANLLIETRIWSKAFHGRINVNVRQVKDNKIYSILELPYSKLMEHPDASGRITLVPQLTTSAVQTPPNPTTSAVQTPPNPAASMVQTQPNPTTASTLPDAGPTTALLASASTPASTAQGDTQEATIAGHPQPRPKRKKGFLITSTARVKIVCAVSQNVVISKDPPSDKKTIVFNSSSRSAPPPNMAAHTNGSTSGTNNTTFDAGGKRRRSSGIKRQDAHDVVAMTSV